MFYVAREAGDVTSFGPNNAAQFWYVCGTRYECC